MPITQFVEKVHLWEFVEKQLRAATIKQCRAPEVTRMLSFLAEPQGTIVLTARPSPKFKPRPKRDRLGWISFIPGRKPAVSSRRCCDSRLCGFTPAFERDTSRSEKPSADIGTRQLGRSGDAIRRVSAAATVSITRTDRPILLVDGKALSC
jgi:hypothetical protein